MLGVRAVRSFVTAVGISAVVVGFSISASASAAHPSGLSAPAPGVAPIPTAVPGGPRLPATTHQQSSLENLFVPVTPCRIVDTRIGGGRLTTNVPRNFYVSGTYGFAPQGGHSGGCGIPVGATAVALNVTTTQTTAAGYLTGYAAGTSQPNTNFISYPLGGNTTANPILPLAHLSTQQLTIKPSSSTQVIIDVNGYYADQIDALIYTGGGTNGVYSGSPRVISVANVSSGVADVTVDRDVTYCTPTATSYFDSGVYANVLGFSGNTVRVYAWYVDATSHLPVHSDNYVYLTITC